MPAPLIFYWMVCPVEPGFQGKARILPVLIVCVLPVDKVRALGLVQVTDGEFVHEGHLLAGGGEEPAAQALQELVHAVYHPALATGDTQALPHRLQGKGVVALGYRHTVLPAYAAYGYHRAFIALVALFHCRGGHALKIGAELLCGKFLLGRRGDGGFYTDCLSVMKNPCHINYPFCFQLSWGDR